MKDNIMWYYMSIPRASSEGCILSKYKPKSPGKYIMSDTQAIRVEIKKLEAAAAQRC
jgi:hypothetical protein